MTGRPFVPSDFVVPTELIRPQFRLEPLGPEHNAADYAAWTGSIDHIRSTPGFQGRWPPADGMSLEANLGDLQRHADDFARRRGFTYTVLETGSGDVIGCVYIYPSRADEQIADVRSWVRVERAELDVAVYEAVSSWLATLWPFETIDYASR
ncbi:N-acetyltransferase [Kribbella capetownensis]|uniref:N-acetyltransferase n=1 Tax=Kribbella capetownensis TaxID=1572659 RepID=A0A4R0IVR6_9ACTN|nr:N-acetyltransferase [Kribbella capetownensis]TCC36664.1 N-acetyltransferase [Kribbella capetownensis]